MKSLRITKENIIYIIAFVCDLLSIGAMKLAAGSRAFANVYSGTVYHYISLTVGTLTGFIPLSLVEILLYVLLLLILADFLRQMLHIGMGVSAFLRSSSAVSTTPSISYLGKSPVKEAVACADSKTSFSMKPKCLSAILVMILKHISIFLLHVFLIASLLFTLYVFNCGINYRRSSFSVEAELTAVQEDVNEETLVSMCEYIIENINDTTNRLVSSAYNETSSPVYGDYGEGDVTTHEDSELNSGDIASRSDEHDSNHRNSISNGNIYGDSNSGEMFNAGVFSPFRLSNGAYIGQTMSSPRAAASFLWTVGKTGQSAMAKIGQKYERLAGPYPFPKPVLNSLLLSVQQTTGVYSPFTIEANYNRDIPYYDIPFTICHELSHLKGYMQEEEANFIAILATIGSDDMYYNYSGFVSAWVYAGNALYKINPAKFSELYGTINAYTLQDLKYNNEYWDQYKSKISEVHEEINDAYLKSNGQTHGVQSYGHVTDLMVTYFAEHGELR